MTVRVVLSTIRRVGAAAASFALLVALVVGIPFLLWRLAGWPLPRSIPTPGKVGHALEASTVSDTVLLKAVALVGWAAWLVLCLALVLEVRAAMSGRPATRLRLAGPFQGFARQLVTSISLFVVTGVASPSSHLLPLAAAQTASTSSLEPTPVVTRPVAAPAAETPAQPVASRPTYVVQRRDSYWAIAERTLGDGLRWREILDLNAGRTLADGSVISSADHTLHIGWTLLLPVDATTPAPPQASPGASSSLVVQAGDSTWTIAEDRLAADLGREPTGAEVVPYWRAVVAVNRDRLAQPGELNLIHRGDVLLLPPTGREPSAPLADPQPQPARDLVQPSVPATTTTVTTTTVRPAAEPESIAERPGPAEPTHAHAGEAESSDELPVAITVGGLSSVALAVGLKRLIGRRRRRFVSEHPGQLPGRTPPENRAVHQAIVAQADEERIDHLQCALGSLADALAAEGSARRPRIIRHADDHLEVLLDQPDPHPPTGWAASDDGAVWALSQPLDPDELDDTPMAPAPLMVTVGLPEDDAQLYLDLEADGLVALKGDRSVAMDLARSILTELTLSPLAETLRVIGVGDVVDESAEVLERLSTVSSWGDIAEDLQTWAVQSHLALVENDWPNTFVARGHDPDHDALVPVAVVSDRPPQPELAEILRANQPAAVAVVVVGDFEGAAAWVRCERDELNFDALGLAVEPQTLEGNELADMARVVAAADSPEDQHDIEEFPIECDPVQQDEPPAYDVFVRLLGDISVEGGRPLKPKATAVVAYIALHRSVTTGRLEEACWFGADGTSHIKRLRDTLAEVRAAIGSQHLPANRRGTYDAGPLLGTDLDLFEWHVQRAADLEPVDAVVHYRAALDLVTGKPFSYANAARNSYGWVDYEHLATTWEHRIAGIAQACSAMYVDLGASTEAIDLLRRIVQTLPLNSVVVESLMRAHLAGGDHVTAKNVYNEHATALEKANLGDPLDLLGQLLEASRPSDGTAA
jgi:DNA-binding SARP family transcriptional activator